MKFSDRKKRKMRKIRQRRIRKSYGYMIGVEIPHYLCSNNPEVTHGWVKIIDKTFINGELYFLVEYRIENNFKYFIYKVVDISKYSCVSAKKIIKYKMHFQNPVHWQEKSDVYISQYGALSVEK